MSLRKKVAELAMQREDLRPYLLPLLEKHSKDAPAKAKLNNPALLRALKGLDGVDKTKVVKDHVTPMGDHEIVVGLYLNAQMGATIGRLALTSLVHKNLDRVLSKFPVRVVRVLPPSPGLDPFGRPGASWEHARADYRKYYDVNPYKLILEVK